MGARGRAHIGPSAISVCLCVCVCVRVGFAPGGWYLEQVGEAHTLVSCASGSASPQASGACETAAPGPDAARQFS